MNQSEDFKIGFSMCKQIVLEMVQGWDMEFKSNAIRQVQNLSIDAELASLKKKKWMNDIENNDCN